MHHVTTALIHVTTATVATGDSMVAIMAGTGPTGAGAIHPQGWDFPVAITAVAGRSTLTVSPGLLVRCELIFIRLWCRLGWFRRRAGCGVRLRHGCGADCADGRLCAFRELGIGRQAVYLGCAEVTQRV